MGGNLQPPAEGNINASTPGTVAISILFTLALSFYAVRIYTQIRPTFNLTAIDYVISVAFVCELIAFISTIIAVCYGFGRYSYYVSDVNQIKLLKCYFIVALFGTLAAPIARLSIGGMLLRFQLTTARKMMLWVLIIIQLAMGIASSLVMLLQCRPIHAFWEPVPGGVCWSNRSSQVYGYVATTIGVCSDIVFAILPIFFIWSLNRSNIERGLMTVLMGLGIVAATAGSIKLYYIRTWKFGEEAVRDTVSVYMWYRVEEISLIASACAPFLKRPIQSMLSQVGVSKFGFPTLSLNTCRTGGKNATTGVIKIESSVEEQSTQDSHQTDSMVYWGNSDCGSKRAKDETREIGHV